MVGCLFSVCLAFEVLQCLDVLSCLIALSGFRSDDRRLLGFSIGGILSVESEPGGNFL